MEEFFKQLKREARGIWRYRWTVALVAWVICVVGWAVVLAMPDVYEARARVYVNTESQARQALGGMVSETDGQGRVEYVRQVLLSRPHLEDVARETDLDLRVNSPQAFEGLIEDLRGDIQVRSASVGGGRDSEQQIYEITYRDERRRTAEAVVQSLLNAMVERSLVEGRDQSDRAVQFLQEQVTEYERRLTDAEQNLADFKRQNVGLLPGEGGDYFSRFQREMEALEQVRRELAIAQERRRTLQAQLAATAGAPKAEDGTVLSPAAELQRQITEQETRLNELLLRYTDKHPDVIATRETLDSLRKRLDELGGPGAATAGGGVLVQENTKIALNQAEVEVAALQGRLAQHQARVGELQRLVNTIPEVEARYTELVRDYGVTKDQYEQLLRRLEEAKLKEKMGRQGADVEFEIIEPPLASIDPVAPNRPRLLVAVLVLGLGAGGGLAWLRNQVNPVFDTRSELYEEFGRPVLGTVSMAWTPTQLRLLRLSQLTVIGATAALLVAFGILFMFQGPASRLAQSMVG